MYDRKSGLGFMQRTGIVPAHYNPEPRIAPRTHLVHSIPLSAPLPLPVLRLLEEAEEPPDRYQSQLWVPASEE
jgi:hypothetical protein